MRAVRQRRRDRDEGMRGRGPGEYDPHRVDAAEERARRIRVDRDPLLVGLAPLRGVGRDDVGFPVVGRDPLARGRGPLGPYRGRDHLGRLRRVRLAVLVYLEAVRVAVEEELVRQHERVKVAVLIERADRVGVVGPTLVPGDVTLHGPRCPAVHRLVEAEEMVVTLSADEPLGLPDEMVRIRRIDADVGLRVVLHQHRFRGWIAGVAAGLRRIGTAVLAGIRAGAFGHAVVSVRRREAGEEGDLGRVAAGPLRRRDNVRNSIGHARRVGPVALGALRHVADPRRRRAHGDRG